MLDGFLNRRKCRRGRIVVPKNPNVHWFGHFAILKEGLSATLQQNDFPAFCFGVEAFEFLGIEEQNLAEHDQQVHGFQNVVRVRGILRDQALERFVFDRRELSFDSVDERHTPALHR